MNLISNLVVNNRFETSKAIYTGQYLLVQKNYYNQQLQQCTSSFDYQGQRLYHKLQRVNMQSLDSFAVFKCF